jgi:hypothetical protein
MTPMIGDLVERWPSTTKWLMSVIVLQVVNIILTLVD